MPTGRNRDPSRRRYKYATSLEKKAFWTTPVPEGTPKPGPKKRGLRYKEALEKALENNLQLNNEWLTAEELAWKANVYLPNRWTQLSSYSVCALLRKKDEFNISVLPKKGLDPKKYRKNF